MLSERNLQRWQMNADQRSVGSRRGSVMLSWITISNGISRFGRLESVAHELFRTQCEGEALSLESNSNQAQQKFTRQLQFYEFDALTQIPGLMC